MAPEQCTILLIRHGETDWNAAGRVQGHTDSSLTELGRAQAEALAAWVASGALPGERPSALYSSDLGRALDTARPIGTRLGLPIQQVPALREMSFGDLEGLSWEEVERDHPELSLRRSGDPSNPRLRPPNGESRLDLMERTTGALESIAKAHPGDTVVVVSHGGAIGFFLCHVLGAPLDARPGYRTPNASVAVFRYQERFVMQAWGLVPPVVG